jgi:hypothetical protein
MPLALGIGQGAAMQQPLAIAIVSGLVAQLPLVLIVLPVLLWLFGVAREHAPTVGCFHGGSLQLKRRCTAVSDKLLLR